MEMPEMMAAWLAETDRIRAKEEPPTVIEEFFVSLTLEFDRAKDHRPDNMRYLDFLPPTVEMYLSGKPDEAMAKGFSAAASGIQGIAGEFVEKN